MLILTQRICSGYVRSIRRMLSPYQPLTGPFHLFGQPTVALSAILQTGNFFESMCQVVARKLCVMLENTPAAHGIVMASSCLAGRKVSIVFPHKEARPHSQRQFLRKRKHIAGPTFCLMVSTLFFSEMQVRVTNITSEWARWILATVKYCLEQSRE